MLKSLLAVTATIALFVGSPATAATITYTVSATGTGILNGTAFTSSLVTLTLVGDTANVLNPGGTVSSVTGTATVNVSGVGTDTFTNVIDAFRTNCPSCNSGTGFFAAGIFDNTLGTLLILATENPVFASYNLATSIGPQSGVAGFNSGTLFPTSLGSFRLSSVAENVSTFTATTSSPEPSSIFLLGSAVAVFMLRHRRR